MYSVQTDVCEEDEGDSLLGSGVGGDDVLGSDRECERDHVTVGVWEDDAELDYEEEMIEEAVKQVRGGGIGVVGCWFIFV